MIPPYVADKETGKSVTREFLVRLFSTAGGPVDLPDGSVARASLSTVLSASVPVSTPLYKTGARNPTKRYVGRASKVASSSNPSEELWCIIADVSRACALLKREQRQVLRYRYFHDYISDESIAAATDLPLAQVPTIEREALDLLVAALDNTDE